MSSEYRKLLHEKSVRSALVKRDTSALEFTNKVNKLSGLKDKPFNACIFNNLTKQLDNALSELNKDNHVFVQHII